MKEKVRYVLAAVLVAALAVMIAGCSATQSNGAQKSTEKLKVITTAYPVYEFTKQVGGDKTEVIMLIPPGAEPHDWEPKPKELAQLRSAKLFLYHGAGLEPVEKLLAKDVIGDTVAVEVSKGITPLSSNQADEDDDHDLDQNDHHHHHQGIDAHMWLDPVLAQQEVNHIAEALSGVDPQNAEYYRQNAARYNTELAKLDEEYKAALKDTARRDIITSHEAFGYLAKRYGLQQIGIMGLAPDSEPTPDKMAKVITFCREHNVKYIFFETLVSPKLSETIAKETGAGLLVLNPLESLSEDEIKQGKNYVSVMRDNLANLKLALQ